jgi:DNA-binding NarL/FixJ family response regulator
MSVIRILIVDDFLSWQHFVLEMLRPETDLQIISVAADGWEAVHKAREVQPDLILMDLSLPGMNGIDATRQIRILSPCSKVLFLSEHRDCNLIHAAFEVGACGYVLKSDSYWDLIPGIRAIFLGHQFLSHTLRIGRDHPIA